MELRDDIVALRKMFEVRELIEAARPDNTEVQRNEDSERIKEKYHKNPDACPYCDSGSISVVMAGDTDHAGIIWNTSYCQECNKVWNEGTEPGKDTKHFREVE